MSYVQTRLKGAIALLGAGTVALFLGLNARASNLSQFRGTSSGLPTMITARSATQYLPINAFTYCRDLSAPCARTSDDVACGATSYTDWRLPSQEELALFLGITGATGDRLVTRTSPENHYYLTMDLSTGDTLTAYFENAGSVRYVRCVR